jgi:hypothetical protein
VSENGQPPVAGAALGSVRELEGALEVTATTRAVSEHRVEAARSAASRLLAAAREHVAAEAAERRRVMLVDAEDDAIEIARRGAESAARVHAEGQGGCAAVVEAALALILPADSESEA